MAVPGPVWRAAVAQLGDVDPKLLHDVHGLRGRDLDEGDLSAAAAVLARWVAVVDVNDAGLECARTAQAFVRCAARTQSGVRLWE